MLSLERISKVCSKPALATKRPQPVSAISCIAASFSEGISTRGIYNRREGRVIAVARVYDKTQLDAAKSSGRYLVERLWPRGMKKESLKLDAWLKDVAPSQSLRLWYSHKVERWPEFRRRYLAELRKNPAAFQPLLEAARRGDITLLYSARDTERNSALVLRDFLLSKLEK